MSTARPIEHLRLREHPALLAALDEVEALVRAIRPEPIGDRSVPPAPPRSATAGGAQRRVGYVVTPVAPQRMTNPVPLRHAWQAFADAARAHVAHERDHVLPLFAAADGDPSLRAPAEAVVAAEIAAHEALRKLAGELRRETVAWPAVRRDVIDVIERFDACWRREEAEIHALFAPEVAARTATPAPDILRVLRGPQTDEPIDFSPLPPPPPRLLERVRRLFGA